MRRAAKSTNSASRYSDATHENHTSGAIEKNTIAAELFAGEVLQDERHQLIAEAAYYRAERRSFAPGCELEDWLDAEAEIETMIFHAR
jgi:hypothetical protein